MADPNEIGHTPSGFVSKLPDGRQRFLSHVIEHALACGRRSPDDFIRHFPPAAIMEGLKDQPHLRGQLLVLATGLDEKIATRKSATSAAEDLQIALDEGEIDARAVLAHFDPDDRVRYLDPQRLWSFLTEGEFWNVTAGKRDEYERAKEHVAFMLERALEDELLSHRDLVEGLTLSELVTRLPKGELHKIIEVALENSHRGAPFTESDLLGAMPPAALMKHVPLAHLWSSVVEPKVAETHGYARAGATTSTPAVSGERVKSSDLAWDAPVNQVE